MKLDTIAIKKEVEHAILMAEELKHDAAKMDSDDIEDYANRIQMVLKRVQKDVLEKS